MSKELMTPDEYDRSLKAFEEEEIQADLAYKAEIADVLEELKIAQEKFRVIDDPAWERLQTKLIDINNRRNESWQSMWSAHLQREKEFAEFVRDLLVDPDTIEAKLEAKLAENSSLTNEKLIREIRD